MSTLTPAFAMPNRPRPGAGCFEEPAVTTTIRPRERAPSRYGCASIARSAGGAPPGGIGRGGPRGGGGRGGFVRGLGEGGPVRAKVVGRRAREPHHAAV